ncbi:hypothetical protein [Bradyrhizobium sp. SZCCHNRI1073]|uniref:hypothetical protein n=1 Tax=Bradyrhizobium sp. SZCCHNRI1073 TaxID=3057280 RepID=UPI002916E0AD|nr:hypothetical protein [Bradyrhizobium sp. SZCCHNRI1073]
MAARFWVGGTGTWDASDTTHWASSSGGAGGASVPGTSDDVTFDGSSGGSTVTVNTTVTIVSLTLSAFTGTLDFSANNNNVTLSAASNALINTGSGTRTFNMGNGTWTLSGASAVWNQNGATNLTFNANSSTIAFTGSGAKTFNAGTSRTYNVVTLVGAAAGILGISATTGLTIGTLTISAPNRVTFQQGVTTTITTLSNISGNSSQQVGLSSSNPAFGAATISSGNNFTGDYCAFNGMTFSGAGTFAGTNSFNLGGNSGITITSPSGSGGGSRVFGG